jgi:hypothetical protein
MKSLLIPLLSLGCALCAQAATVYINSNDVTINALGAEVLNAKFRASQGNFDASIATGSGTGSGNAVGVNLGTVSTVTSRTYIFNFSHRVGQGYLMTTTDNRPTPTTSYAGFGSNFVPAPPPNGPNSNVQATLAAAPSSPTFITPAQLPGFNSLRIDVRVSEIAGNPAEQITLASLAFSSSTLSMGTGAFTGGTTFSTTPGNASGEVVAGAPVVLGSGLYRQRLVADVDLTQHDWDLSGSFQIIRSGGGDGEAARIVITGQSISAITPILAAPEPSRTVFMLMGLGLMLMRRRRHGC